MFSPSLVFRESQKVGHAAAHVFSAKGSLFSSLSRRHDEFLLGINHLSSSSAEHLL